MRAISRLTAPRRALDSSAPVADWKRRLKSSCRVSLSLRSRSSSESSRRSFALVKEISLPLHELGLDGELLAGEADGLAGERLRNAGELEHDAARLDDRDPVLGRALAGAHAGLRRLLRRRLVREDVDPDLAAALDLARHRDTGSLDLPVGDPTDLERLQPVLAELHLGLALRLAAHAAALHLPVLGALGEQHQLRPFLAPLEPEPSPEVASALGSPDWSSFVGSSVCTLVVVVSGASATGAATVSTCGSITGCSRPSALVPVSSVRGRSTRPPPPPGRPPWPGRPPLWPPGPPGRPPGRRFRSGPRPSRSRSPPRAARWSRPAGSASALVPRRRRA